MLFSEASFSTTQFAIIVRPVKNRAILDFDLSWNHQLNELYRQDSRLCRLFLLFDNVFHTLLVCSNHHNLSIAFFYSPLHMFKNKMAEDTYRDNLHNLYIKYRKPPSHKPPKH